MITISAASLSASSWRPPFWNCSIESRRCLIMVARICWDSFSSRGARLSISLFLSAALTMRKVESLSSLRLRMASTMSFCICSLSPIMQSSIRGRRFLEHEDYQFFGALELHFKVNLVNACHRSGIVGRSVPGPFSQLDILGFGKSNASPVFGRAIRHDGTALALTAKLVAKSMLLAVLQPNDMRAHFADQPVVGCDDDLLFNDGLMHRLIRAGH